MPDQPAYRFHADAVKVSHAISNARDFLGACNYPLGDALLDHVVDRGDPEVVVTALAAFQNADGGFGRGLEVDIAAPASNPFAARLAMTALTHLVKLPETDMVDRLAIWLEANQVEDGDWHLSAESRCGELAPWFAAWQHPDLNPACCIAAYAHRLGIASPRMLSRTASLFAQQGSVELAATSDFYGLLPYVEYVGAIEMPNRNAYLAAIATNIAENHAAIYADAGHFWEHVLAGGPDLVALLPTTLLDAYGTRLLDEQQPDGGWPTPYDQNWRPWFTTMAAVSLHAISPLGRVESAPTEAAKS